MDRGDLCVDRVEQRAVNIDRMKGEWGASSLA